MSNKYFLFAASLFVALSASAQETYENARLVGEDLNGTARYVGMGGALEALGADISTISTNPAGLGLFRHSNLSVSGGLVMQSGANNGLSGNKTSASFDQIGAVYSTRTGRKSFLNFGFNYHKSRNYNFVVNAAGALNGSSQNKQSYLKGLRGSEANGGFYVAQDANRNNEFQGYVSENNSATAYTWNQVDYLYWNTLIPDAQNNNTYFSYDGESYNFNRNQSGYISNYDFNISGNINDRVYLGVTFGLKDVHYNNTSLYNETLVGNQGSVTYANSQRITGSGFDVTAGIIVRPIETSPFRIGAYVKTPTWYDLTTQNSSSINNNVTSGGTYDTGNVSNSYDFKIWTPWKFGVSLGHTIGNYLALGATYEFEDYKSTNTRINNGGYYDYFYDEYYDSSDPDNNVNRHTKNTLKGVSTLKLGVEVKPISNFAIRVGYNYVSPAYSSTAQKDPSLASVGSTYTSTTDFTNWKAINRVTFGLGYQARKFNIDLAYQYSAQNGEFAPFSTMTAIGKDGPVRNVAPITKVKNNKSQLLLTLGYHF